MRCNKPEEVVDILFSKALPSIKNIEEQTILKQYEELKKTWGAKNIVKGDKNEIREIILKNSKALSEQSDIFQGFRIDNFDDSYCQLNAFFTNKNSNSKFIPIRVWKQKNKYFATGDKEFKTFKTINSFEELLKTKTEETKPNDLKTKEVLNNSPVVEKEKIELPKEKKVSMVMNILKASFKQNQEFLDKENIGYLYDYIISKDNLKFFSEFFNEKFEECFSKNKTIDALTANHDDSIFISCTIIPENDPHIAKNYLKKGYLKYLERFFNEPTGKLKEGNCHFINIVFCSNHIETKILTSIFPSVNNSNNILWAEELLNDKEKKLVL